MQAMTEPNTKAAQSDWAKEDMSSSSHSQLTLSDLSKGNPKGAMLTHENVVANAAAFLKSIEVSYC